MKKYDFEEERVKQEISRLGAKKVLLQLPDGLKNEGLRLAKIFEKMGALPVISADPCYGACDLATEAAESLDLDLIVHYGHSKILKHEKIPTVYVEARATLSVAEVVGKALPLFESFSRIGLATTVQHIQTLDEAKEILVHAGKTVVIGDAGKLNYPGQLIGCDFSNAKSIAEEVDAFLFIGGGRFHAIGLAISTLKPTIVADPYEDTAYPIHEEAQRILQGRWAQIKEAEKASRIAILVGLKPGQKRLKTALSLREKLIALGKEVFFLAAREITPDIIMNFPSIEAYINTACPRISLDDSCRFRRPIITTNEALVLTGELSWKELCEKGWFHDTERSPRC